MVTYFVKIFSAFDVIGSTLPSLPESATDQILSQILSAFDVIGNKLS
jgi:hypothetical protein